jgi:hypothetical protein
MYFISEDYYYYAYYSFSYHYYCCYYYQKSQNIFHKKCWFQRVCLKKHLYWQRVLKEWIKSGGITNTYSWSMIISILNYFFLCWLRSITTRNWTFPYFPVDNTRVIYTKRSKFVKNEHARYTLEYFLVDRVIYRKIRVICDFLITSCIHSFICILLIHIRLN